MKITFYGTRGSISVSEPEFYQFGGNTSCVLVTFDNGRIAILDAGTGIRKLGREMLAHGIDQYDNVFKKERAKHLTILHRGGFK